MKNGLMIGLSGATELSAEDKDRLNNPCVGGVILFSKNFESSCQLRGLTADIRRIAKRPFLIAVDQEGGRVQRFSGDGFTFLPAMSRIEQAKNAYSLAHAIGIVIAAELLAHGVDLAFSPVLDIAHGHSEIIGSRAFSSCPDSVARLSMALVDGLRRGGMIACGKHFPGHGFVAADSHTSFPVDNRTEEEIRSCDLIPFQHFIAGGGELLMSAHVTYSSVDSVPATFSSIWLQKILREQLNYKGIIVCDDMSMKGAFIGETTLRLQRALDAGCQLIMVCHPQDIDDMIEAFYKITPPSHQVLEWPSLRYSHKKNRIGIGDKRYRDARDLVLSFH